MSGHGGSRWTRAVVGLVLALGAWLGAAGAAQATEPGPRESRPSTRLEQVTARYLVGGALGFRLSGTAVEEQLYRRPDGQGLLWGARFTSAWRLDDDQLDRWSAQAIGLLVDSLGADTRLAGWERLPASDVGERRIAYRYRLATAQGAPLGEATIVVFARGAQVGISGAGALGAGDAADALDLARVLDDELSGRTLAAGLP